MESKSRLCREKDFLISFISSLLKSLEKRRESRQTGEGRGESLPSLAWVERSRP
jgi:hypothetical protein